MRVDDAKGNVLAFDNMFTRGLSGTADWTDCTIELDAPATAHAIYFGILAPISAGTARARGDHSVLRLPSTLQPPRRPRPWLRVRSPRRRPRSFAMTAPAFDVQAVHDNPVQGKGSPPNLAGSRRHQPDAALLRRLGDASIASLRSRKISRAAPPSSAAPLTLSAAPAAECAQWAAHNAEIVAQKAPASASR